MEDWFVAIKSKIIEDKFFFNNSVTFDIKWIAFANSIIYFLIQFGCKNFKKVFDWFKKYIKCTQLSLGDKGLQIKLDNKIKIPNPTLSFQLGPIWLGQW